MKCVLNAFYKSIKIAAPNLLVLKPVLKEFAESK